MIFKFLKTIADILFPDFCCGCGTYGFVVCSDCIDRVRPADAHASPHILCSMQYKNPVTKNAIRALKTRNHTDLANDLGRRLAHDTFEEIANHTLLHNVKHICIIPVPLSRARYSERGHNQSELIATGFLQQLQSLDSDIAALCSIENAAATRKHTAGKQAITGSREQRFSSLAQVFSLPDPQLIAAKHIIIIDDVSTTGATLLSLRSELLSAGAASVQCLAVAH